jgi:hypothetical protein
MSNDPYANLNLPWWLKDQLGPAPQALPQAPLRGLLKLLAAVPVATSPPANAKSGATDTTTAASAGGNQTQDRKRLRYLSGLADQVNGQNSGEIK